MMSTLEFSTTEAPPSMPLRVIADRLVELVKLAFTPELPSSRFFLPNWVCCEIRVMDDIMPHGKTASEGSAHAAVQALILGPEEFAPLYNIAQAYRQLNNCEKSLFFYERFLAEKPGSDQEATIKGYVLELKSECGAETSDGAVITEVDDPIKKTSPTPGDGTEVSQTGTEPANSGAVATEGGGAGKGAFGPGGGYGTGGGVAI